MTHFLKKIKFFFVLSIFLTHGSFAIYDKGQATSNCGSQLEDGEVDLCENEDFGTALQEIERLQQRPEFERDCKVVGNKWECKVDQDAADASKKMKAKKLKCPWDSADEKATGNPCYDETQIVRQALEGKSPRMLLESCLVNQSKKNLGKKPKNILDADMVGIQCRIPILYSDAAKLADKGYFSEDNFTMDIWEDSFVAREIVTGRHALHRIFFVKQDDGTYNTYRDLNPSDDFKKVGGAKTRVVNITSFDPAKDTNAQVFWGKNSDPKRFHKETQSPLPTFATFTHTIGNPKENNFRVATYTLSGSRLISPNDDDVNFNKLVYRKLPWSQPQYDRNLSNTK